MDTHSWNRTLLEFLFYGSACVVRIQVIVGEWNNYNVLFLHRKPSVCRALSPLLIFAMELKGHLSQLFVGEMISRGPRNYGCCSFSMQPLQAAGNEDRQLVV